MDFYQGCTFFLSEMKIRANGMTLLQYTGLQKKRTHHNEKYAVFTPAIVLHQKKGTPLFVVNGSVFLHKERRITSIGSMCLKLTRTRLHSTKICNIFIGTKKTPWCPWTLFIQWILKLLVVQIHSTQQSWLKITCRLGWWHFCDCHKMRKYFDANLLHYCDVLVIAKYKHLTPFESNLLYSRKAPWVKHWWYRKLWGIPRVSGAP